MYIYIYTHTLIYPINPGHKKMGVLQQIDRLRPVEGLGVGVDQRSIGKDVHRLAMLRNIA